ncbi:MAG: phosphate acyltransferase [Parafannyhessea umbonata]|uniref:Phosphate acetyltransferase n=1 Tax=Parafannyhessea umbonata TaxID=604330 RepID=A0A6N7WU75_9ACTN|nr:phosphate acyltransferase [Parafannyhessea umbonata]MDD6359107.1 phosphate acyltransferase [Parafannyhessea umbonata]MDD6602703.1 phosphate acyltransferase [Parafannyhessea umbonata]MDY4014755.1 phosphate acyltransferase [Parafannyhessea umbonata]MST60365.1 phosphate acetyltransferase [Parafannyhessea umbonata]
MSLMDDVRRKAAQDPQRVAFYEGENPKILEVAAELTKSGLARCTIVGDAEAVRAKAQEEGVDLAGVELVDVTNEEENESFSKRFEVIPDCPYKSKGVRRHAARAMDRAFMMQRIGDVDVSFGGIDCSTGDVILAGEKIIGLADGVTTVSSAGIFDVPGWEGSEGNLLGFADSAVCVNPDSQKLAQIAVTSARTVAALTGWEPRVAMLSYSTDGSSEGELVQKVRDAVAAAHELAPELKIDGEFQLDAAIRPDVAAKKVHRPSEVAGRANVIVWPDINVGNIGVKLVQNFAHANAYGPFLQGFKKVVCDCSRSSPVPELVGNVVMSCVRAQALKED